MPPWLSTVVASIASVLVAVFSSSWFSKRMMRRDILDELSRRLDNVDSALSEMADNDAKFKQANVALLRDRFMSLSREAINEGSISFEELQTIKDLSIPYFELDDVTGEGKVLLSKVEQLPIKN